MPTVRTVVGLFRSSYELDKVMNQLLSQQFHGSQINVIPMQETEVAPRPTGIRGWFAKGGVLGDTIDRADGTSVMDGTIAGATVGGLAGVIYGAMVVPGPVALGVGGILLGGLAGYLLDIAIPENRRGEYAKGLSKGSTVVLVRCSSMSEADAASLILKENQAHQLGRT